MSITPAPTSGGRVVLDLTTVREARELVRIDGNDFRLNRPADFTLAQLARFNRLRHQATAIPALPDDADEGAQLDTSERLETVYAELMALLLPDAPHAILDGLDPIQRRQIFALARGGGEPVGGAPAASPGEA